jgi:hypothetical protein
MSDEDEVNILECRGDGDEERMLITDLIEGLTNYVASVPEEVRAEAYVKLTAYGDYASAYLGMGRNETTLERVAREAKERLDEQRYRDERKEDERRQYERLKQKYESQ